MLLLANFDLFLRFGRSLWPYGLMFEALSVVFIFDAPWPFIGRGRTKRVNLVYFSGALFPSRTNRLTFASALKKKTGVIYIDRSPSLKLIMKFTWPHGINPIVFLPAFNSDLEWEHL